MSVHLLPTGAEAFHADRHLRCAANQCFCSGSGLSADVPYPAPGESAHVFQVWNLSSYWLIYALMLAARAVHDPCAGFDSAMQQMPPADMPDRIPAYDVRGSMAASATGSCNLAVAAGACTKAIGLHCGPSPVSSVLQMNACNTLPPCPYCAQLAAAYAQIYMLCMVMVFVSTVVGSSAMVVAIITVGGCVQEQQQPWRPIVAPQVMISAVMIIM